MPLPLPASALALFAALLTLASCAALVDHRADRREAAWEAATPPLGRFVTVEGRRVHLLEAGRPRGTAPDLVLIHGANGNLRDFTVDLVGRLEGGFRILAMDRPGLGHSDSWGDADSDPRFQARVLQAAAAQAGITRPIVLGHSYGGAVAVAWALEAPQDTAALVLLAAAVEPWEVPLGLWYRLNDTPLGGPARALVAAFAPETFVESALAGVFAPDPLPPGYGEGLGAGLALRRSAQEVNNRQVNALLGHVTAMQRDYPGLTLPIEVLHGDADRVVGLEIHARPFSARAPGARLTVLPGTGHMPHHARPDAVVEAVQRAARRAAAGG